MRSISAAIVRISALEEENRNYNEVIEEVFLDLNRKDEIGALSIEYFNVLCLLHSRSVEKQNKPKYPRNPFYAQELVDANLPTWQNLNEYLISKTSTYPQAVAVSAVEAVDSEQRREFDLDILGGLADGRLRLRNDHNFTRVSTQEAHTNADIELDYTNTSSQVKQPELEKAQEAHVDIKDRKNNNHFHQRQRPVQSAVTSVTTKFYILVALMFGGILAMMIVTAVTLQSESVTWMSVAQTKLIDVSMIDLSATSFSKGAFAQVSC